MVLLLFFLYFSIVQYIRIVVEPLEKNAPHLAISRLRDALSYKAVKSPLNLRGARTYSKVGIVLIVPGGSTGIN